MRIRCTCAGDLGRGGPGETGRSMWLVLASGLSGGLSSSGGDGVLASRRGPESLRDDTEIMRLCDIRDCDWPDRESHDATVKSGTYLGAPWMVNTLSECCSPSLVITSYSSRHTCGEGSNNQTQLSQMKLY